MNKQYDSSNERPIRIDGNGYMYIEGDWSKHEKTYIHQIECLKKYNLNELPPKTSVHHLNMNKLDNSPDNLILISDSDHKKLHNYIKKHPEVLSYNEEETKQLLDNIRDNIEEKTGDLYEDAKLDLARLLSKRRLYKKDSSYMTKNEIDELENKIKDARLNISKLRAERAKLRKPRPDKDTLLKDILKFRNFEKLADYYGVSSSAVRKWCKKYDIDYHKYSYTEQSKVVTKICPVCGKEFTCTEKQNKVYCSRKCSMEKSTVHFDKDEILDMLKTGLSIREIGRFYGVHHNTVIRYLTRNNIGYK